ncbi:glycosyltransferase [Mycobacterium sp. E2479]|uniref:glycosyltransferase n=1 Tax=Mycobacterium sp. E2479 TaxID=1834134 RepID=UPI0007FBA520|nr:glycosyltransferase [Mycobacterium sp. E2479]OBH58718.1 glycosyl transferase [Mycobacterium sp. E2479]
MKTVSVVVPVYYNAQSLPLLFAELREVERELHERDCGMELIFVDDGSGDESMIELMKIKQQRPDTRVIKLTRNFGAIHSSKVGLNYVTGDCTMWLAADLQDPPELVVKMTDQWLAGSKFVIALRQSRVDPPLTTFFAGIYHWLVRRVISKDYPKGGIDILLMDAALVPHIRDSSKNVNTELLAHWLGYKPATVPYQRRKRQHGKSRWTFGKKLTYFFDSILGFSVLPIRFISLTGFLVALLSFAYGLYIVVDAIFGGHRGVAGFPTLVALISFLLGVVIIILGIIGEYVWRIFDEVTTRPEAVVDEVY